MVCPLEPSWLLSHRTALARGSFTGDVYHYDVWSSRQTWYCFDSWMQPWKGLLPPYGQPAIVNNLWEERWCWSEVCWTLARAKIADARILGCRGASLLDGASRDRQVTLDKYKKVQKRLFLDGFFSGDARRKPGRRPTSTWEPASQQRGQGFKSKDKLQMFWLLQ